MNLRLHLIMTTYPLGKPPHLPDYIKNNRYIIGLEKDMIHENQYKDHLCFFHCLAIGKFGKTRHNCNGKAKELFQDYCQHFRVKPQDFEGVELDEFPELEKYFEVELFAMFLKEDGSAKTLYLSQVLFPTKIYMNVNEHHLSLITDIQMYSKQYICTHCDKLFSQMQKLKQHQSKCDGTVKYVFPGGIYKNKLSVFEELEEMGVRVREEDKYEKWFVCFDFEVYQRDFDEKVDADEENSLKWKRGCHGIKYMCQCHLVQAVMCMGWRHVMCRVRILESWYLSLLLFCWKWVKRNTRLLQNDLNIFLISWNS